MILVSAPLARWSVETLPDRPLTSELVKTSAKGPGPGRDSDRNSGPAWRSAIRRGSRCAVSVPHVHPDVVDEVNSDHSINGACQSRPRDHPSPDAQPEPQPRPLALVFTSSLVGGRIRLMAATHSTQLGAFVSCRPSAVPKADRYLKQIQ